MPLVVTGLVCRYYFDEAAPGMGFTLLSRTHLKRLIMAIEERHDKKKKVLGGVQT